MRITVRGADQVDVPPDLGRLYGQVSLQGADKQAVMDAVTESAGVVSRALDERRAVGQVSQVVIRPISVYGYQTYVAERTEMVHQASVAWSADFANAEALAVFCAEQGAGAGVQIQQAEWLLSDQTRVRVEQDCLTRAVAMARARAQAIAAAAGAGEVRFVEVSDPDLGDGPGGAMAAMARAESTVDVRPADVTVRVELRAVFEA